MGTFNTEILIGDPQGSRYEPLEALVDTGAAYTVISASLLRRLGVAPNRRALFELADGRTREGDIGETRIRVDTQAVTTLVVFGEENVSPILGAYALEGLQLMADPVNRRLVPVPRLPLMQRSP